jgi:hypothetical protein
MGSEASWMARFEQSFKGPVSPVRARIWRQVYGPEYPAWADPFSYVSVTELRRFARELQAAPGRWLVDAGCGRGGPRLWVAAATGARLMGIREAHEWSFCAVGVARYLRGHGHLRAAVGSGPADGPRRRDRYSSECLTITLRLTILKHVLNDAAAQAGSPVY